MRRGGDEWFNEKFDEKFDENRRMLVTREPRAWCERTVAV